MKTQNIAAIVKINPPRLASNIYLRKRLFKALDEARSRPVIWITAPPGAGKTTLISTYLEERKLPCLWYQIDEGDGDIASFFHYMGIAARQAAPRFRKPLPNLTPEYLLGLPTFTRNYFRELYSRVSKSQSIKGSKRSGTLKHRHSDTNSRFIVVLDNYQDAPANSPLHEIIQTGLSEMPEGINVIIISRVQPPDAMARIQSSNNFTMLKWDDLKLTNDESIGIARLRSGKKKPSQELLHTIHEQTQGWVAGLILLLEQTGSNITPQIIKDQASYQTVFDYFAGEIFQRADKATQEFLLKTSSLPKITTSAAALLTGRKDSGDLLNTLVRRNYFTIRLTGAEGVYEYHPLFRAFLENRLARALNNKELAELKNKAAHLLIETGNIEDAVPLLHQTEDWQTLTSLVLQQAPQLVQQGRSQTVEAWIHLLPPDVLESDGWLLYWLGACRLASDPVGSRSCFERSFERLTAERDNASRFLAWAGIVDTFVYEWGDFAPLDRWIRIMDEILEQCPGFPSPEIEARVASGMFSALCWRQTAHPNLQQWAERVQWIVLNSPQSALRMALSNTLILNYLWTGEFSKANVVIDALRPASRSIKSDPLTRQHWLVMEAMHSWFNADHATCLAAVAEGEKLAETTAVHLLDLYLYGQGVFGDLTLGNGSVADGLLEKMSHIDIFRIQDKSFYHYLTAAAAWHRGDLRRAVEHGEAAIRFAEDTNSPVPLSVCHMDFALTLYDLRRYAEASDHLYKARKIGKGMNLVDYVCFLHGAWFALNHGRLDESLKLLSRGMALGARQGYVNFPRWRSDVMSRLCALALENGIEPEYAQHLIKTRRLSVSEPYQAYETWPWLVKICTLGRFSLFVDGKSVRFSGKIQKKPLELLKALIAFGGSAVNQARLTEALWPDAEGDVGRSAFDTTLHRLRKLIGDKTLLLEEGKLTLDPLHCWVDIWALEHLMRRLETMIRENNINNESLSLLTDKLLALYKGQFLHEDVDEAWLLTKREETHNNILMLLHNLAKYHESRGDLKNALALYQKGIALEPLIEEFYQKIMSLYHRLGCRAEAVATYHRCSKTLAALLQTPPSQATHKLYREIIGAEKQQK